MDNQLLNYFPEKSLDILSEDEIKDLGILSGKFIEDKNNTKVSIPLENILERMNIPLQAYARFLDQISKMEFNDKDLNKYFESNSEAYNENAKINRNGKLGMAALVTATVITSILAAKSVAEKNIDAKVKIERMDTTKTIIESATKIACGGLLQALFKI